MKAREKDRNSRSEGGPKPPDDPKRYPEEDVIDALLEAGEGDETPPPEEDIFALPVLPRDEGWDE